MDTMRVMSAWLEPRMFGLGTGGTSTVCMNVGCINTEVELIIPYAFLFSLAHAYPSLHVQCT